MAYIVMAYIVMAYTVMAWCDGRVSPGTFALADVLLRPLRVYHALGLTVLVVHARMRAYCACLLCVHACHRSLRLTRIVE